VGDFDLRFAGVRPIEGPNYDGVGGTFVITRGGAPVAVLTPQKRQFWVQRQVTSETAIKMTRGSNILLALGEDLGAGRWSVRVQVRPLVSLVWLPAPLMVRALVSLVWLAALVMATGAVLAASDRRYRAAQRAEAGALAPAEHAA